MMEALLEESRAEEPKAEGVDRAVCDRLDDLL